MAECKDKLLYLNARARGEAIRLLYVAGGKEFVDERINFASAEFKDRKKDLPLGQVPILTTNEGVLPESNVIARYVAKKLGLAGSSLWEEALHDVIVEATQECMNNFAMPNIYKWKIFKVTPEPENSEQILEDAKNKWIKVLNYIQSIAEKRGKKYIVGDDLGLAELWLYAAMQFCEVGCPDIMSLTPWAKKFAEGIESDPKLTKYLAERPKSML